MAQHFKPARFEAIIIVLIPALVLAIAVSFAYMAWRPSKGVSKVVTLPGLAPHEVVKPPAQAPVVVHAYPANPPAPQAVKQHVGDGATEPTPENPVTVLPVQGDEPDSSNSDGDAQTTGNTSEGSPTGQSNQNQQDNNQGSPASPDQTSPPNSGNSTGQ